MLQRQFVRLEEDPLHGPESTVPSATLCAHEVQMALRPYVSNILSYRETFAPDQEAVERVIPDGAVRLIVKLGKSPADQDEGPAMLVLGPSAAPSRVALRGDAHGLAITLRPGATEVLLGVPAREIAGAVVALDALWSRDCDALVSRLVAQTSDPARIGILQDELDGRLRLAKPVVHRGIATHALRLLIEAAGKVTVRDVASSVGIGERRLQQLFDRHIGLSPRTWRRLARLHSCLRILRRLPDPEWSDVALEAGYYDQSHLINEFQALCGCTPTEFRRESISGSSKIEA